MKPNDRERYERIGMSIGHPTPLEGSFLFTIVKEQLAEIASINAGWEAIFLELEKKYHTQMWTLAESVEEVARLSAREIELQNYVDELNSFDAPSELVKERMKVIALEKQLTEARANLAATDECAKGFAERSDKIERTLAEIAIRLPGSGQVADIQDSLGNLLNKVADYRSREGELVEGVNRERERVIAIIKKDMWAPGGSILWLIERGEHRK